MDDVPGDSENVPGAWQDRLESLKLKHKEESLEQQRLHLAQLRQLQDVLMSELAKQCNSGAEELDEDVMAELLESLSLGQVQVEGGKPKVGISQGCLGEEEEGLTAHGGSVDGSVSPIHTPLQESPCSVDHSDTTQPWPLGTESTPVKPKDPLAQSSLSIASTEYLELPTSRNNKPLPATKHSLSPPLSSIVDQDDTTRSAISSVPAPSLSTHGVPPQQASLLDASDWSNSSHDTRSALMEKHTRHIEDLQAYYETQLSCLQEQLSSFKLRALREKALASPSAQIPEQLFPSHRLSYSPSKGRLRHYSRQQQEMVGDQVHKLMRENRLLQEQCSELEQQVDDSRKSCHALQEKFWHLQQQQYEWEMKYNTVDQHATRLQTKLSSASSQLREQTDMITELNTELNSLSDELEQATSDKAQLKDELEQVYDELELVQEKYKKAKLQNRFLEDQLSESHSEISYLRATIDQQQTIINEHMCSNQELESKVRSLSLANNRLNSQATHFELGSPNLPDEGKIDNSTSIKLSPYKGYHRDTHHQFQLTPTSPHSQPTSSRLSSHESHLSGNKKLTKRQWLESSNSGLAYGSIVDQTPPVETYRRSPTSQRLDSVVSPHISLPPSPHKRMEYQEDGSHGLPMSIEERVEQRLRAVSEAEKRLEQLQKEKERLESIVQKVTPPGYKAKIERREAEEHLDEVIKEIGSVRMTLRLSSSRKK